MGGILFPMKTKPDTTIRVDTDAGRAALSSPLRLEILGLFTRGEPLAIADMAGLMGRKAGSLYHHVGILEKAGLLRRTGTRPKGKRHEALFMPAALRVEMETPHDDEAAVEHALKALSSAFRMTERDLGAAVRDTSCEQEGPGRNLFATRMHMRATPELLAKVNGHLKALEDLLLAEAGKEQDPEAPAQHLSLTIALLPIKGRSGLPESE